MKRLVLLVATVVSAVVLTGCSYRGSPKTEHAVSNVVNLPQGIKRSDEAKAVKCLEEKYSAQFTVESVVCSGVAVKFLCSTDSGIVLPDERVTIEQRGDGYYDDYPLFYERERLNSWLIYLFCEQFSDVKAFVIINGEQIPEASIEDCELPEFYEKFPEYVMTARVFVAADEKNEKEFRDGVMAIEKILNDMHMKFRLNVYGIPETVVRDLTAEEANAAERVAWYQKDISSEVNKENEK